MWHKRRNLKQLFFNLKNQAGDLINKYISQKNIEYDIICGVPYGAFAVATSLSLKSEKPMVFKRKEAKDYGKKNIMLINAFFKIK